MSDPGRRVEDGGDADRVTAWVESRVHAAERRLELQAQALEAALASDAEGARVAAEAADRARASLAAEAELLAERSSELDRRLQARIDRIAADGEHRLHQAAAAAESRLAAADRAQEREERVRARIRAAEEEADRRVREAERRLVDVLGRIGSVRRPG